ncbi:hypothetical protein COCCADRAFT_31301 [Bipolaris zeicola 26-R-13]|uniref:FAD dependent oxidoreductase domain-containing protein n=1 Tax=Cochliobolus carbonum (strain 26-R-13) TaxID=930089 RepID=W6XNS3_COCC2|nr:uncharacterized protein COCCADRAFT_31301 [Bipolaris zeicola 26-R-13]EUC27138.1 hypothetical protein COCCADRAFT_31301 [Bipolaris zeicola 26-R-13]
MTGTSIAHHFLKNSPQDWPLRIAMVEARQACSGATGRNGGHIRPSSYAEYDRAKSFVSKDEAARITRMRAAHINALIAAANELDDEGREASEARVVDSIEAVRQLNVLKKEVPDLGIEFTAFDQEETQNLSLRWEAAGMITGSSKVAGAIWPYRFVTHKFKSLVDKYPSFFLDINMPALNVYSTNAGNAMLEVTTSRGKIQARHAINAVTAWIPHLVPAWSLYRGGLSYIVQMPQNGEFMFGGGCGGDGAANTTNVDTDDSLPPNHGTAAYLNGALPGYVGYDNWGPERSDFPSENGSFIFPGRTKRVWTGMEGASSDGRPLVGMIPTSVTRRSVGAITTSAQWILAAYDGEGMCFAWLCGQALASMLLGREKRSNQTHPYWFPLSFELTEERMNSSSRGRSAHLVKYQH